MELCCEFVYSTPGKNLGCKGAQITWVNVIQISYMTYCNLGSLSILWRSIKWNFDHEFSNGGVKMLPKVNKLSPICIQNHDVNILGGSIHTLKENAEA